MAKIARVKLSQAAVDRLKPAGKESWIMDSEVIGLGVRQRPGAATVYAMRWKDGNGRDRKMVIGPTSIKLDDARNIAKQRLGEIARGDNPLDARAKERHKQSVSELVEAVIDDLVTRKRSDSYVGDLRQQWRDHLQPHIGGMRVSEVTTQDVDRLLARHRQTPFLHNRLKALLSRMFKFAVRWGYRPDDPTYGAARMEEPARERLLSPDELDRLLVVLERNPCQSSDAIRLLALTGSRPQELFAARWLDFDLEAARWTKPAQTVKKRKTHVVELHPVAVAALRRIQEEQERRGADAKPLRPFSQDGYVFPGRGTEGHLTTIKKHFTKMIEAAGITNARPYDLRKAFASRLMASGADIKTVMSLTGHTQANILLKHYAQVVPNKQGEALAKALSGMMGA